MAKRDQRTTKLPRKFNFGGGGGSNEPDPLWKYIVVAILVLIVVPGMIAISQTSWLALVVVSIIILGAAYIAAQRSRRE